MRVTPGALQKFLGAPKTLPEERLKKDEAGIATGLAWTATGGDVLFVEATVMKGTGPADAHRPPRRRDEGVGAGRAVVDARPRARRSACARRSSASTTCTCTCPEGSIPKDGPSAGVTMATALVSAFTGRPVKASIAMTGEITLRGHVLPIGGLKEKILAARRAGIDTILCPKLNKKELDEVPAHLRRGLTVHLVETVDEVLSLALLPRPDAKPQPGTKTPPRPFPGRPRRPVTV